MGYRVDPVHCVVNLHLMLCSNVWVQIALLKCSTLFGVSVNLIASHVKC